MNNLPPPSSPWRSILAEVAATISFSMNLLLMISALTPRLSPPANPYATNDQLLWIAPLWVSIQLLLAFIGVRSSARIFRLAALFAIVTPILLIFLSALENWPDIHDYWRNKWR